MIQDEALKMNSNKQYFLVKIDLEEQRKRLELLPGFTIANNFSDMKYYLQCAPVISIGSKAAKWFPEVELGDVLVFHHTVEDDEWRVVYEDLDIKLLLVRCTDDDVFGVQKIPSLEIIPSKNHVWCVPFEKPKSNEELWEQSGSIVYLPDGSLTNADTIREEIEKLQEVAKFIGEGINSRERVADIKRKQAILTQSLNNKVPHKHIVKLIHTQTSLDIDVNQEDIIYMQGWIDFKGYPLQVDDQQYLLIRKQFIFAKVVS